VGTARAISRAEKNKKRRPGDQPGLLPSSTHYLSRIDSLISRLDTRRAVLLICLCGCLAYANSLGGAFVFDDTDQITQNPSIRSWTNLARAFTTHVWAFREGPDAMGMPPPPAYYRPLFTVMLTVEYHLFGLWPQGWHVVSLALYLLCAAGLYRVLLLISGKREVALIASALFVVFPVHSESVSWISGMTDPLFAVFLFASFWLYLRFRADGSKRLLALSLMMYLMSVLSKETAVSLPILVFIYELIESRKGQRHPPAEPLSKGSKPSDGRTGGRATRIAAGRTLPYLAITTLYLIARLLVLKGFTWTEQQGHHGSLSEALLTLPLTVCTYILHLMWPINLSPMYNTHYVTEIGALEFLLPAAGLALFGGLLVRLRSRIDRQVLFGIALLFIPLLPVLDLRRFSEEYLVWDHYLFVPAAGFCYLAALGICRMESADTPSQGTRREPGPSVWARPWLTPLVLMLLLAGYTVASARENSHWADSAALWSQAARVRPASWQANYNRGLALLEAKRLPEAKDSLQRAASLAPDKAAVFDGLGRVFNALGDRASAIASFQKSIGIDSNMFESLNNLGAVYFESGTYPQAESLFLRALTLRPQAIAARYNLGVCYLREDKIAESIVELEKVVEFSPADSGARFELGTAYERAGRKPDALAALEAALPLAETSEASKKISDELDKIRGSAK
jgi:tetratricopeptide (TPR) repeat protein